MTEYTQTPVTRVRWFPSVRIYVSEVLSINTAAGTVTVDPGDGEAIQEVPYYGDDPKVGENHLLFWFDDQLALISARRPGS